MINIEPFNTLADVVSEARSFNDFTHMLGFRGNVDEMKHGTSAGETQAEALIFCSRTSTVEWHVVYQSAAGPYFKKGMNHYL